MSVKTLRRLPLYGIALVMAAPILIDLFRRMRGRAT
jgi:hypothetical protein